MPDSVLSDQRVMTGSSRRDTVEEIVSYWDRIADERAKQGYPRWPTAPGRIDRHESRQHVLAYVSDGRWVADCLGGPNGICRGGIATWPEHDHGCCLDCGTTYRVDYPTGEEIAIAERALAARPPENRHWLPHQGERAHDLEQENILRGFHPSRPYQEGDYMMRQAAALAARIEENPEALIAALKDRPDLLDRIRREHDV